MHRFSRSSDGLVVRKCRAKSKEGEGSGGPSLVSIYGAGLYYGYTWISHEAGVAGVSKNPFLET